MSDQIRQLRAQVTEAKKAFKTARKTLTTKQEELRVAESHCHHVWGPVKYVGYREPGYYIPGDKERGIEMGVDAQLGMHVSPKEVEKWQRKCTACDKVETTDQIQKKEVREPKF